MATLELKPRLCVDFDGTIFDGNGLFPGCVEILSDLQKEFRIAIFSARATDNERYQMMKLLAVHDVPFDEILDGKPEAAFYLDDKARQFRGWEKVREQLR